MECPYCWAELQYSTSYGNKEYIIRWTAPKTWDIYYCENADWFSTNEEAEKYLIDNGQVLWDDESLEDVKCDSNCFNVIWSFYTDRNWNLHEGFPC